jgi:hypothetical protein
VIDRCNLTILEEPGQSTLAEFLAANQVEVVASLPCGSENKSEIRVKFILDSANTAGSLRYKLGFGNLENRPAKMLPGNYFTIEGNGEMIIKSGQFNGGVLVHLTDAFFEDTLSCETNYILPLKIVSSTTDEVLDGDTDNDELPDPRFSAGWNITPRNFTIYSIKYVNQYHGRYLLRGECVPEGNISWGSGAAVKSWYNGTNKSPDVEKGDVVDLTTKSLTKITYKSNIKSGKTDSNGTRDTIVGIYAVTLDIKPDKTITVTQGKGGSEGSILESGTGTFAPNGQRWGDKPRNAIYVNLKVKNLKGETFNIKDTLTFRDNAVKAEEFTPVVLP